MDDSDESLKFEIDPSQFESTSKKKQKVRRIEGRTVIIRRADGKKPPPVKYDLDTEKLPRTISRRQMAMDMSKKSGQVQEDRDHIDKISFIRRGIGFLIDCTIYSVVVFLVSFIYQEKIVQYHLEIMSLIGESWFIYSESIYLMQIFLPCYFVVFFLPVLFFEGSIGKRFVGFKIIQNHGASANFDQMILREIIRPISILSLVGILLGVFRPYRTLHDRISRTKIALV
jgi:uncharacterized RDD family membrane protein YckC